MISSILINNLYSVFYCNLLTLENKKCVLLNSFKKTQIYLKIFLKPDEDAIET